jgi:hypothetical protein
MSEGRRKVSKIAWHVTPGGGHFRDYFKGPWSFEETVARLITASGQPAESSDQEKSSVDFVGVFEGQRFTLYDYKEDRQIHIGGENELNVAGLIEELTKELASVQPTEYVAREFYNERKGHQWPRVHA